MPDTVLNFEVRNFFLNTPPSQKKNNNFEESMAAKFAIIHMNAYSISKMVQAIFIDSTKNVPVPVCTSVKKYKSGE